MSGNTDPSAQAPNQLPPEPESVDLGEFGRGLLYNQEGQTFDFGIHNPNYPVILQTEDSEGKASDWLVRDGLMVDLVKLFGQHPEDAAIAFGRDAFTAGYPSTMTIKDEQGIPVPKAVDASNAWGREKLTAVLEATGSAARPGSTTQPISAMDGYYKRVIPGLGISLEEFMERKKAMLKAREAAA